MQSISPLCYHASVKKDAFINCILLLLFGIQHFFAFPVLNDPSAEAQALAVETSPARPQHQQQQSALFDLEAWIDSQAKRSHKVLMLTLVMWCLVWQWRPLHGIVVWDFRGWKLASSTVNTAFYVSWFALFQSRIQQGILIL